MTGNTCKYKHLLCCMLCSLLLSCVQEENESSIVKSGIVTKVFNAMLVEEDTSETKVSLDGSYMSADRSVFWNPDDEVAVFEHGSFSVTKFINISKTSAASCVLEGITYDAESYSALYPFGVVKSVDEDNVYLTLPTVQHYYEDDIDPSAFPMAAKLNGNTFNFKNICGVLVLQLQGEGTVESISFKGYDSNSKLLKVAGDAYVNHSYSSVPSLHMGEESATSVELSCGAEGVKLSESESTPFHIILPPATYSSFELNIVLTDGRSMKKSADNPLVIQRSMRTTASAFKFEDVISVSGVTLDKISLELAVGDEATLIADVTPDNASNKNVVWTSSNPEVTTVENGKVTAVKAGTATITVTTEDRNKTATCKVTVTDNSLNRLIEFADIVMKELCVDAFDTNADGELSYAEAAEVTDLSQMVLKKKTFKTFDELKFFTGIQSIPFCYFEGIGIKSIIIPENVKTIEYGAFRNCMHLSDISIPNGLELIGNYAFCGCEKIESFTMPESVIIGSHAFEDCSMLKTINGTVNYLNQSVFAGCSSLTNISLGDVGEWIIGKAFLDCTSLTNITIPDSVTSIDMYAFAGCTNLKTIVLSKNLSFINVSAFSRCESLTYVEVPDGVSFIGEDAFYGCLNLSSFKVPDNVTAINKRVFGNCSNLTNIILHDNITEISQEAFLGCSSLETVAIPESVTTIGEGAFKDCSSLELLTIPESVCKMGSHIFEGCSSLMKIDIPESVMSIGSYAFKDCVSLEIITIPESISEIGIYFMEGCSNLTTVEIPESVTTIGSGAFKDCSKLKYITIPENIREMSSDVFKNCSSLENFKIPKNVSSIDWAAFQGCNNLKSIVIPENVVEIDNYAFSDCISLESIFLESILPPSLRGSDQFVNNASSRKIYVPLESCDAYKTAKYWSEYADAIVGYDFENDKVVK